MSAGILDMPKEYLEDEDGESYDLRIVKERARYAVVGSLHEERVL